MLPEVGESPGKYILRCLRAIVEWHTATEVLVGKFNGPTYTHNIDIRLVEVPRHPPQLLTYKEMKEEFGARLSGLLDWLPEKDYPLEFGGTVHAEATLMGLYALMSKQRVSNKQNVNEMSGLQDILTTVYIICDLSLCSSLLRCLPADDWQYYAHCCQG